MRRPEGRKWSVSKKTRRRVRKARDGGGCCVLFDASVKARRAAGEALPGQGKAPRLRVQRLAFERRHGPGQMVNEVDVVVVVFENGWDTTAGSRATGGPTSGVRGTASRRGSGHSGLRLLRTSLVWVELGWVDWCGERQGGRGSGLIYNGKEGRRVNGWTQNSRCAARRQTQPAVHRRVWWW